MNGFSYQEEASIDEKDVGHNKAVRMSPDRMSLDGANVSIDELQLNISGPQGQSLEYQCKPNYSFQSTEETKNCISFSSPLNQSFPEIKTRSVFSETANQVANESVLQTTCLKFSVLVFSLIIAGYQCLELTALLSVYEKKNIRSENNPIVRALMKDFLDPEMLLFRNVELNILITAFGLIVVVYSSIVLFVPKNRLLPGLDISHRKLAKRTHICFLAFFLLGALVQSFLFLTTRSTKTVKQVVIIYSFLILRGGTFYVYMYCYKYAVAISKSPQMGFEGQELRDVRKNAEEQYDHWEEFYDDLEAPDDFEEQDRNVSRNDNQKRTFMQIDIGEKAQKSGNRQQNIQEHEINVRGI